MNFERNEPGDKSMPPNGILLRTKLNIPITLQKLASRARIVNELNSGLKGSLILVTAPAGFGKTTAVADWIRQTGMPVAWFSIDAYDNGLKRFWSYLIAALDRIIPGIECRFSQYLYAMNSGNVEDVAASIVDELFRFNSDFILVLDDYHLITEASIHESLAFLLKYLPQNAHVAVISRSGSPFGSVRLQTVGEIKEIGIPDLQFTTPEITELCKIWGVTLSKTEVNDLEMQTEGWAAGLYLLLESAGRGNHHGFFRVNWETGWDHRRIASYLTEEVMDRVASEEKEFMLVTSVLTSMSAPLCNALTGRTDGKGMLEKISKDNAFIVRVDSEGSWYRYHHLFSDLLQKMLSNAADKSIESLHERAGEWYESSGYHQEAVSHFIKGGNYVRAAAVIEKNGLEMLKTGDFSTLRAWFDALPASVIEASDMLCLIGAWSLMLSGCVREALPLVDAVEQRSNHSLGCVERSEWEKQMRMEVSAFRGILAVKTGNTQAILRIIAGAEDTLKGESIFFSYGLNFNTGDGNLLAGMLAFRGQLSLIDREYGKIYEKARSDVLKFHYGYIPALMGELLFERNNIEGAVPFLAKGMDEAESSGMAGSYIPSVITLARVMKARGDVNSALEIVADGERKLRNMGSVHLKPVLAAFKARLGIECGDNDSIEQWMKINCLDIHDRPNIRRAYEYITLARVLFFRRDYDNCILLLSRLLLLVKQEKNFFYSIETLNLMALAYNAAGHTQKAMDAIRESLEIGEMEGYERIFVEEGIPMAALLGRFLRLCYKRESAGGPSVSPVYLRKLLKCTKDYCMIAKAFIKGKAKDRIPSVSSPHPLTRREKEVLRFLSSELTNSEIACTLDISLNTVKVNCTNIYRKLDVKNRDQAIRRARELNMLNG